MRQSVIIHSNSHTGEFFRSTSHQQGVKAKETYPEGFIPVTHYIPHYTVPRPGLRPDGKVETVDDVLFVYYSDQNEIPQPGSCLPALRISFLYDARL